MPAIINVPNYNYYNRVDNWLNKYNNWKKFIRNINSNNNSKNKN